MTTHVSYLRGNADTSFKVQSGFIAAYRSTFGGAPYYESYSSEEVFTKIWEPHITRGIVILALQAQRVIGFGCCIPLFDAPTDVQVFLRERQTAYEFTGNFTSTWYMSELGVLEPFRRRGIGRGLNREQLSIIQQIGGTQYVLRTAAVGSNSVHLYQKLGATELTNSQDVSALDQVQVNQSQSTKRIYLHGSCVDALAQL